MVHRRGRGFGSGHPRPSPAAVLLIAPDRSATLNGTRVHVCPPLVVVQSVGGAWWDPGISAYPTVGLTKSMMFQGGTWALTSVHVLPPLTVRYRKGLANT